MSKKESLRAMTLCGMLIALDVVIARFLSVNTPITRIGFSFVPLAVAAYLYGPVAGALVHGISDVIGAVLFPLGPYFPGYTLTAVLIGVAYGLCLRNTNRFWRVAVAVAAQTALSLFLSALWITVTSTKGATYGAVLVGRLPQVIIMAAVQLLLLPPVLTGIKRLTVFLPSQK